MPGEPLYESAVELARQVREGEVSARSLAERSLARIETVDPALNHFTLVDAEGALVVADAVGPGDERPFAGVPIAIKDLSAPAVGMRMTQGSELVGDYVPDYDSAIVRRLRDAGFTIVGRTNTPELGILPVTEPRRFGPARNPWDPTRTTGGSSGGAAGAVAVGSVPVAHGSDGGGSLRIPAACCGLVGLKPSRGRVSAAPDLGDSLLVQNGVQARTTVDAGALLDVLAGPEPGDATWAPAAVEPFADAARRDPRTLRIAICTEPPIECDVDPLALRATSDAGVLLEALGHQVEEVAAPWAGSALLDTFAVLWAANISLGVLHAQLLSGRAASADDVEPLTWWLHERGQSIKAPEYLGAVALLQRFARKVIALWEEYDVVLTPALAQRPVRHGEIDPCGADPETEFRRSGEFTPYTAMFNVTGQPAVSVPLFEGEDGLPLAVQLVGPPLGEDLLLSLCGQVERAHPWAARTPPEPVA